MKQETVEEAAENHLQKWRLLNNIHLSNILHAERCKNDFIAGAKWQQERMFELVEEYNQMIIDYNVHEDHKEKSFKEWFEQFKKK